MRRPAATRGSHTFSTGGRQVKAQHVIVLNTLQRVQRFMDTNDAVLGSVNDSGYRHVLDDVVTALKEHAVNQNASQQAGQGETARQRALRSALRQNHMRPIATIALAELPQVPEFVSLKMPANNVTPQRLIAAAGAMGAAAAKYESTFTTGGLATDFLAQLEAAANAVERSLTNRGASTTTQAAATAGLVASSRRGRAVVRVLDSLVRPQLAGDAALLAQWNSAKRFSGKTPPVPATTFEAAAIGANAAEPPAPSTPSVPAAGPSSAAAVPA
jgi:hypothetical protein